MLCEPWPCNPEAATALQPLIRCSEGLSSRGSSHPEVFFPHRNRHRFAGSVCFCKSSVARKVCEAVKADSLRARVSLNATLCDRKALRGLSTRVVRRVRDFPQTDPCDRKALHLLHRGFRMRHPQQQKNVSPHQPGMGTEVLLALAFVVQCRFGNHATRQR